MKQKNSDNKTLRWLWTSAKGKKRYVALLIIIGVTMALLSMGYVLFLSGIVDAAAAKDWELFRTYCVLLIAQVAVLFVLRLIQHFLAEYTKASLENGFKKQLFRQLLTGDYAAVTATHSGEWLNRLTSDAVVVANAVTDILPGITSTVARLITSLALVFYMVPIFGVGFLVGGALVILVTWVLRRSMKRLHKQVQVTDGALRVFLTERLGSMMILRAFGQEDSAVDQGVKLMNDHKSARMKRNHISNIFHTGFSLLVNVVYVVGAIYCGYGILVGTMSYGTFTAMLQLVARIQQPIGNISGFLPQYSAMLASAERLMEVEEFALPEEAPAVEDVNAYYSTYFRGLGLRDAGFTYLPVGDADGDKQTQPTVLKNLNLQIMKGEYVAFCGPSGCGKSTVLKLLMSMYTLDEGQRYLLDGEGEKPLNAAWRGLFAYVPQGNQLMSGTIRDVVTFAAPDQKRCDEQIWRALNISCADQFIRELPEGLDTLLGERGAGLSEGQMQRIAIARAVFSQRPILLLDEATSALDELTEAKVLDNLRNMTDKTVIIVTHRPKALEITDKTITFTPNEE